MSVGPGIGTVLVGRQRELEALEEALDGLASGTAAVAEVVGEPGIGKSRLIAEFVTLAERSKAVPLSGRASEFERDLPFAPVVAALDDYLASLDSHLLEPLGPDILGELGAVFPSLARWTEGSAGMLQAERHRLYRAIRALLEHLAFYRPIVLLLDDLHWADPATIELVASLLRRRPTGPILLVLAHRPMQTTEDLVASLGPALRDGSLLCLELAPLPEEDAWRLIEVVGGPSDPPTRRALYRESGGNPFYLEQLARRPGGPLPPGATGVVAVEHVPAPVAAALSEELSSLSPEARLFLRGAAVAGDPFDPGVAGEVVGLSRERWLVRLDELLMMDVLRTTEVPTVFRFRHPIVRRAVYESAPAGWRMEAHQRAAAALASRGSSAVERAHHVERSAGVGDEAALGVLVEAARQAAPRAPRTAAHWFRVALRLLPAEAPERRRELLIPLATALASAGRLEESVAAFLEALDLVPSDAATVKVEIVVAAAAVLFLLARHEQARSLLHRSLQELPDRCSVEAAAVKVAIARSHLTSKDPAAASIWAEEALRDAKALGDTSLALAAEGIGALRAWHAGRMRECLAILDRAAELLDGLDDAQVARRIDGASLVGWAEALSERVDPAVRHLERALRLARATGQEHVLLQLLTFRAFCHSWQGELAVAAALLDDVMEAALLSGNREFQVWARITRGSVAIATRDIALAVRHAEQAVEIARGWGELLTADARRFLASALQEAGESARAIQLMVASGGGEKFPRFPVAFHSRYYETLVHAELALGRIPEAQAWAERAERAAQRVGLTGATAWAQRARAAVLLALRDPSRAVTSASASAEAFERAGNVVEAARSRILAGRALAAAGERRRAVTELLAAEADLAACGAERFRDEAARELRRLGHRLARSRVRAGAERGVPSLSERERQVAERVAEGRTNRQIAGELFLSEKTVETHLSRVFTKLAVSSRAAVAAALVRGLTQTGVPRPSSASSFAPGGADPDP